MITKGPDNSRTLDERAARDDRDNIAQVNIRAKYVVEQCLREVVTRGFAEPCSNLTGLP